MLSFRNLLLQPDSRDSPNNKWKHVSHQVSQHQDKKKTKCIVFLRLPVLQQSNISSFPFCLLLFSCSPSWSHCYEEEIESYMGSDERTKHYLEQSEKGVIYPWTGTRTKHRSSSSNIMPFLVSIPQFFLSLIGTRRLSDDNHEKKRRRKTLKCTFEAGDTQAEGSTQLGEHFLKKVKNRPTSSENKRTRRKVCSRQLRGASK